MIRACLHMRALRARMSWTSLGCLCSLVVDFIAQVCSSIELCASAALNFAMRIVVLFACLAVARCGDVMDDIVNIFANMPAQHVEPNADMEAARGIVRTLASYPAPVRHKGGHTLDPIKGTVAACERDYAQVCPSKFANVGGACVPTSGYNGPCRQAHSFNGLSATAKERWSSMCLAWWPCVRCDRDFGEPCPVGWTLLPGSSECETPIDYSGPCTSPADFAGFNREMFSQWSGACGAYWACSQAALPVATKSFRTVVKLHG